MIRLCAEDPPSAKEATSVTRTRIGEVNSFDRASGTGVAPNATRLSAVMPGAGLLSTACTMESMVALPPMPTAMSAITAALKPGDFVRMRVALARSRKNCSSEKGARGTSGGGNWMGLPPRGPRSRRLSASISAGAGLRQTGALRHRLPVYHLAGHRAGILVAGQYQTVCHPAGRTAGDVRVGILPQR